MKILLLGTNGFPYGLASVEKQKLFAKALQINSEIEVEIICNNSFSLKHIAPKGFYENIKYRYTCLFTERSNNVLIRKINAFYGRIKEIILLFVQNYDYSIISSRNFFLILEYVIIAKIRGKKIFLTSVEDKNIMPSSKTFWGKIDNYLYQKYVWKIVNGAFPISEELTIQIMKSNPSLPILKIPVMVDINLFKKHREKPLEFDYFLFCGAAAYFNTITFIIDGYSSAELQSKLVLVINGSYIELGKVSKYITDKKIENKVDIVSQLPYERLIAFYQNAKALLIPLNFNQQDKARMPHKIGEYCASKRPIISSNWGEIGYYFTHRENALLLNNRNTEEFSFYLKEIEENESLSMKLSKNAYDLAEKKFHYENYSNLLNLFLKR